MSAKYTVNLSSSEIKQLQEITSKGKTAVRKDLLQKSDIKCDREPVGLENNELPNSQKSETRRLQTIVWCE